jgi:hypothetical protein
MKGEAGMRRTNPTRCDDNCENAPNEPNELRREV